MGGVTMPLVCFLTAWREGFRNLFFIPVVSLISAVIFDGAIFPLPVLRGYGYDQARDACFSASLREVFMLRQESKTNPQPTAVVFRSPRNWTAVVFFGALGSLHLGMALTSYTTYQAVLHMSVVFGALFVAVAVGFLVARHDVTFLPDRRRIIVRTGIGRLAFQRCVLFSKVVSVRVTLLGRHQGESSVSVICPHDEIELPPTLTPRQEGLLLAMMMGVRLVKVYGDGAPAEPAERIARLYRNEDAV